MQATLNRIAGFSGIGKTSTKKTNKRVTKNERVADLAGIRKVISVGLGIAIPALSLTLAHVAGTLVNECPGLALFIGICGVSILVVSLSHLAEAIHDATGAAKWQGWAIAITLDLSIIGCELSHVFSKNEALWYWTTALMVVVMLFSMILNVYAFLKKAR